MSLISEIQTVLAIRCIDGYKVVNVPVSQHDVLMYDTYAALDLLHACQRLAHPVTFITRLRLDAALYQPAPAYSGVGRPRKKGARLPSL